MIKVTEIKYTLIIIVLENRNELSYLKLPISYIEKKSNR